MFKELDELLESYATDYESNSEIWSVDGSVDAIDIIRDFQEEDWKELKESLKNKSPIWETLLAECLIDRDNPHTVEVLNMLTDTNDKRLFRTVVCRLNEYDLESIKNKDEIVAKIKQYLPESSEPDKMYFDYFLKKKIKRNRDLKIFTDNIEETARQQIDQLLEQDAFKDSKVRIMPDVHAGKSCVIGFTGDLGEKVIPYIVGGDIGCGMFCANLGAIDIDYKKLDEYIHENIPSGQEMYSQKIVNFDLTRLYCYDRLKNIRVLENSIGTLGGGNHFIEIDESQEGNKYLIIHTGSRNLGAQVANYYQELADQICNHGILDYEEERVKLIDEYKSSGREKELESALKELGDKYKNKKGTIPYEYTYLEGKYREAYLHDMKICQEYAILNRLAIAKRIANYMGWSLDDYFESVHNYISFEDNIVRKGSISARKGEPVIIPINMRDGCIIGYGKGNADWNYSAPHGAGRTMSRKEASERIDLEEYKESMANVYTTSVNEDTKDEAPFAYKGMGEILDHIVPTVEVTGIIKPVYNFKATYTSFLKEKEQDKETQSKVK